MFTTDVSLKTEIIAKYHIWPSNAMLGNIFLLVLQLLIDYTYSQVDNLLLVLLKTGSVLNFDTTYNPCLAKELWEPTIVSQKINCFALVSFH